MRKTVWILVAFLFVMHILYGQEEVQFRFKPEVGKPLKMKVFSETETSGAQEMIMEMQMNMTFDPTEVNEDIYTIETTIDDIKIDMMVGMQSISYDSTVEPEDEMSKMIREQFSVLENVKIRTYVNTQGKTTDVEFLGVQSSPVDLGAMTQNLSATYPDYPIKPGDSWTQELKGEMEVGAVVHLNYTFKEETDEGYLVDIEGEIKDESGDDIGTMEGYYILDKDTHLTKKSEVKVSMSMSDVDVVTNVVMALE